MESPSEPASTATVESAAIVSVPAKVLAPVAESTAPMPPAPVPEIVRVKVPGAAVPAWTVNVELPPEVIDPGLKLAEAPDGTPDTPRLTVCADPEVVAVLIVAVPIPFGAMASEPGFADIEKS